MSHYLERIAEAPDAGRKDSLTAGATVRTLRTMLRETDALIMKRCLVALFVSLVVMGAVAPVTAQGQYVSVDGRVQWIAGNKMMLIPDSGALPIDIDITRVPLGDYRSLRQGDPVVVSGVVSSDGRRVLGTSVRSLGGWGQSP